MTGVIAVVTLTLACAREPYRLRFGDLSMADRIEVTSYKFYTVTDRDMIRKAAAFFERYRDGWTDVMDGGSAPYSMSFYKDGKDIGSFGVGPGFLSVGPSRRYPPETEIAEMVRGLGLPWPRPQLPVEGP
jgi:hypothetical protein